MRDAPVSGRNTAEPRAVALDRTRAGLSWYLQRPAVVFVLLLGALVLVYWPALAGGLLWDDPDHVTKPALRSLDGLVRIWTDPSATKQYYPLTQSLFWLESRLWGDRTVGYHLVNVVLHALGATLVWTVLRLLGARGAGLAAV